MVTYTPWALNVYNSSSEALTDVFIRKMEKRPVVFIEHSGVSSFGAHFKRNRGWAGVCFLLGFRGVSGTRIGRCSLVVFRPHVAGPRWE